MNAMTSASGSQYSKKDRDTMSTAIATDPSTTDTRILSVTAPTKQIHGDLYRFHGFQVFDRNGQRVGIVDWVWSNESATAGDHIGVGLQWLRGRARAIPAMGALIDTRGSTIWLPVTRAQIKTAPRFKIDRPLAADDRARIHAHFRPSFSAGSGALLDAAA